MIDSALVRDLGMRGCEQHLNVQWFGGHAAQESTFVVDLLISGAGMQKQHKLRNVYAVSNLQLPLQSLITTLTCKPASSTTLCPGQAQTLDWS